MLSLRLGWTCADCDDEDSGIAPGIFLSGCDGGGSEATAPASPGAILASKDCIDVGVLVDIVMVLGKALFSTPGH